MTLPDNQAVAALLRMKEHIDRLERARQESIAVVGLAARTPFEAQGLTMWQGLSKGIDASREVPSERWDADAYYDPDVRVAGKAVTKRGSFLPDVAGFDASFFGIAPVEAHAMDPQQRIVLETAWEAFADAGVSLATLRELKTGVFLGSCTSDYGELVNETDIPVALGPYLSTGTGPSIIAGRVSYALGLMGPCLMVDTACSSSLVALHLACESLRARTSDVALAGGVQLVVSPATLARISKMSALSSDGRCRAFDASGTGFGRGEGSAIVVLKRLSDALRDGDRIHAIVRGTAVNQDGKSDGLTAPNGLAQQQVIRTALEFARLTPADVQYVEAHGTGTVLGDPIEVEALSEVYGTVHRSAPLAIGSLKSNVGHLEGAAGVAGLIKAILSIQQRQLPPSLHFKTPNPHVPWEHIQVRVQSELGPWPSPNKALIAGVSSFGISGTNAHVLVSEAPPPPPEATKDADRLAAEAKLLPLCVSARTPEALRAYAKRFAEHLSSPIEAPATWRDVSFTSSLRSTHLEQRLVVVGGSPAEWAEKLATFADGKKAAGAVSGDASNAIERAAFVFSGQGTQWWGMARELIEREPVFRTTIEECARHVRKVADWDLVAELGRDEASSRLSRTDIAQPAIVAVQIGLVRLLASWGIEPAAVVGHSVGEIAAAFAAGVLTLEQACQLATVRGRVMHKASGNGRMAAVRLSAEKAEALAREFSGPEHGADPGAAPKLAHLVLQSGERKGKSYRIKSDDVVLGRARGTDIRVKVDGVSRRHARIVRRGDEYILSDVASTNGTFVNGESISAPVTLKEGDEVRLGHRATLKFVLVSRELDRLYEEDEDPPTSTGWGSLEVPTQRLVIGAYNGPESVVISGEPWAMKRMLERVSESGGESRELHVDYAFHSPQMDRFTDELAVALQTLEPSAPRIPIVSTLTGSLGARFDSAYWVRQMREPVRFVQATRVLLEQGYDLFVEIGAHPALLASIDETASQMPSRDSKSLRLVPTLRRNGGHANVYEALAGLHCAGYPVRWEKVLHGRGRVVSLPSYPWQRQRYWLPKAAKRRGKTLEWALMDSHVSLSDQPGKHVFEVVLDLKSAEHGYLVDHRVQGDLWFPGAGFTEMALQVATTLFEGQRVNVEDVVATQALTLHEDAPVVVQLVLTPAQEGTHAFRIASRPAKDRAAAWMEHATGRVTVGHTTVEADPPTLDTLRQQCREPVAPATFYEATETAGVALGPAFQGIERAWAGDKRALSQLAPVERLESVNRYVVHPTVLDSAFQTVFIAALSTLRSGRQFAVATVKHVHAVASGTPRWVQATLRSETEDALEGDALLLDENGAVLLEVKGVRAVALGRAGDKLDSWLYEVSWRASAEAIPTPPPRGRWLVLADETGVGKRLEAALVARGLDVVTATRGLAFTRHDATHFQIHSSDPASMTRLLKEAFGKTPPTRIVQLFGLDTRLGGEATLDEAVIRRAQDLTCTSNLHLAQAIAQMGWSDSPRLFVVTRDCQPAKSSGDVKNPEQALAWGFGASISHEMSELRTTLVDIDGEVQVEQLARELWNADDETRVALRGNERRVPRLVRRAMKKADPAPSARIDAGRTYLVTGGLGGLGLVVAQRLAKMGAKHLALLGRSAPSLGADRVIRELEAAGSRVYVLHADIAKREDVVHVLDQLRREAPPIDGVVHAAGVVDDGTLTTLTAARVGPVLGPKVLGALVLDSLLPELTMQVHFASASGLLGSAGQANYAAANAFLDAFAHHITHRTQRAVSLDWGAWDEVGLAARADRAANAARQGLTTIRPEEGAELFERALSMPGAQIAPLPVDFRQWRQANPLVGAIPFLSEVMKSTSQRSSEKKSDLFDRLRMAISQNERVAISEEYVRTVVAGILRSTPEGVSVSASFKQLGFDSLTTVSLKNSLERDLAIPISVATLFAYPTVSRLAGFILNAIPSSSGTGVSPAPSPKAPESPPPASHVEPAGGIDDALAAMYAKLKRKGIAG